MQESLKSEGPIAATEVPAGTHATGEYLGGGASAFGEVLAGGGVGCWTRAGAYLNLEQRSGQPRVLFTLIADYPCAPGVSGKIVIKLEAPSPVAGRVLVDVAVSGNAFGSVHVDVGNDGLTEVSENAVSTPLSARSLDIPASAGPAPVWIVVDNIATNTGTSALIVTVECVSDSSSVAPYGNVCGHGLSGFLSTAPQLPDQYLSLRATGAPAGSTAYWLFGTTPIQVPIAPTGCELLTNIVVPVLAPTNPWGEATQRWPIATGTQGVLTAQYLELGPLGIQTSNALTVGIE